MRLVRTRTRHVQRVEKRVEYPPLAFERRPGGRVRRFGELLSSAPRCGSPRIRRPQALQRRTIRRTRLNPERRGVISLRCFNVRVLSYEHVLRIYRDREALGILSIRFFRNARRTLFGIRGAHRRALDFGSGGGDESAFLRLLEPYRRFRARTRPKNGAASEFRWKNRHRRHSEPFVQGNRRMRPVRDLSLVRYRSRGALSHSNGSHLGLRGEIRKRMGRRFQARKRVDLQRPVRHFGGSLLPELPMNGKFPRIRRTTGRERDRLVGLDGLFDRHVSQLRRILLLLQLLTAPLLWKDS